MERSDSGAYQKTSDRNHKVLIIAYEYPPISSGGVQRPAKFVKYLPENGWQPYVISTDKSVWSAGSDETLVTNMSSNTPVWRIPTPYGRPLSNLYRRFPGLQGYIVATSGWRRLVGILLRVFLFPLAVYEYTPIDPCLWWALRIVPFALRVIYREGIDVVFTTCPPWSVNVSGLLLSLLSGRPWVADFRDPWTGNALIYRLQGWRDRLSQRLEKWTLRCAHRVTCAWKMDELLAGDVEGTAKCSVIHNGFDYMPTQSVALNRPVTSTQVSLLHLGTVYPGCADSMFDALTRVLDEFERYAVKIVFLGNVGSVRDAAHSHAIPDGILELLQWVPYAEVSHWLTKAAVLVLALPDSEYGRAWCPGKLYEYIASGTPILAIVPEGNAADIVRSTGTGIVVHPEDDAGLVAALRQIACDYPSFHREHFHPVPDVIAQYERSALTRKLAELLDRIVQG